jgi:hypothetical protein
MNDNDIKRLKKVVESGELVLWNPDQETAIPVCRIGPPPKPADGDVPEPSECAWFTNGKYAALYNCDLSDFVVAKRLG